MGLSSVVSEVIPNTLIYGISRNMLPEEMANAIGVYAIGHTMIYYFRHLFEVDSNYINPQSVAIFLATAYASKKMSDYMGYPLSMKQMAGLEASRIALSIIGFAYLTCNLTQSLEGRVTYLNPS